MQLDTMNVMRATRNNYSTELRTRGKLREEEKEEESEGEEQSETTEERKPTEEYNGQEQTQEAKCSWHERGGCNREECKFRHPNKVCKNYIQDQCKYGTNCRDNHPKRECPFWARSNCKKGEYCNLKHAEQRKERRENSPPKKTRAKDNEGK